MRTNCFACQYLTLALRAEKEFGLAAVALRGCAVQFLSVGLRGDRDIGLAATRNMAPACQYSDVFHSHDIAVEDLSEELRGDMEIGVAAVRRSMYSCKYLTLALRMDKEFGLAAVALRGRAVQFLSLELRGDRDIGLAAVRETRYAFEYLTDALRADIEFCLAAVTVDGYIVKYLSVELSANREIGLMAVKGEGGAFLALSAELQADKEIGLAAVANDRVLIRGVSHTLRKELLHLAAYWSSDVETVACAELNPLLIQLDLCDGSEGGWAEVVCLDVAGSVVARCLVSDFEYMIRLYAFVASEVSVPPMRLKFLLPCGSLHQIGNPWEKLDDILALPRKKAGSLYLNDMVQIRPDVGLNIDANNVGSMEAVKCEDVIQSCDGEMENGMLDFPGKKLGSSVSGGNFSRHPRSGLDIHEKTDGFCGVDSGYTSSAHVSGEIHGAGEGLDINEDQCSSCESGERGESSSSESGEIHESDL